MVINVPSMGKEKLKTSHPHVIPNVKGQTSFGMVVELIKCNIYKHNKKYKMSLLRPRIRGKSQTL